MGINSLVRGLILVLFSFSLGACLEKESFEFEFDSSNSPGAQLSIDSSYHFTTSQIIPLKLNSEGATEMAFFLNSECSYKKASNWETYSSTKNFELPDKDGEYKIGVIFRNEDHFPSECQEISLTFDRQGPLAPTQVIAKEQAGSLTQTPEFYFSPAVDVYSPVVKHQARVIDTTNDGIALDWTDLSSTPASTTHQLNGITMVEGRLYAIEVRGIDKVGNLGAAVRGAQFYAGPILTLNGQNFLNSGVFKLKFSLSSNAPITTIVSYQSEDITTLDGYDYFSVKGAVTIPQGQNEGEFLINVRNFYHPGPTRKFKIKYSADYAKASLPEAEFGVPPTISRTDSITPNLSADVAHVSSGPAATCATLTDGKVKCWGYYYLFGRTKTDDALYGLTIDLGGQKALKTAASGSQHCALLEDKTIKCWGYNGYGFGDGTSGYSPVASPVTIPGLINIEDIFGSKSTLSSSGAFCVLKSNGGVSCWGKNTFGELGTGDTTSPTTPVDLVGYGNPGVSDPKMTQVSIGGSFGCGLTDAKEVYCWGTNTYGGLGVANPPTASSYTPIKINSLTDIEQVDVGSYFACARNTSGQVFCWGWNQNFTLGKDASTVSSETPLEVSGLGSVKYLAISPYHACIINTVNKTLCWGSNENGEMGHPFWGSYVNPIEISPPISYFTSLTFSSTHGCGLTNEKRVYCWGRSGYGADGRPTANGGTSSSFPINHQWFNNNIKDLYVSHNHICITNLNDKVYCSGYNNLTDAMKLYSFWSFTPELLSDDPIKSVSSGLEFLCFLKRDSRDVFCRGKNNLGQLGDGTTTDSPTEFKKVIGLPVNIVSISSGLNHTCALTASEQIWCWGLGASGQLGYVASSSATAQYVGGLPPMKSISAGGYLSCGLSNENLAFCWGANGSGQLGNGTNTSSATPTQVSNLTNVTDIQAGYSSACAILAGGALKCWGYNGNGQLGNGTTTSSNIPVTVTGITSVTSVSLSALSACATNASGRAYCWGYNNIYGILGTGSTVSSTTPALVTNIEGGAQKIFMGTLLTGDLSSSTSRSCVLTKTQDTNYKDVRCWGMIGPILFDNIQSLMTPIYFE